MSPFQSERQRRYLYAREPAVAAEFQAAEGGSEPDPWLPGEHVAVVGQTGSGKTHLIDRLVREHRRYVVVFKTKLDPEDEDWEKRKFWRGFKRIERAREINNPRYTRFLLAPRLGRYPRQYDAQVREGHDLIDRVFKQGNWTVVFDEEWYCEHFLGMKEGIELLYSQGRGKGISVVAGAQRPSQITRFMLSQAQHVFAFAGDARDAKTLGEYGHAGLRDLVAGLGGHDFAYYAQRTRRLAHGNARSLGRVLRRPRAEPAGTR